MTVSTATAAFIGTALPSLLFTWRCKNTRCHRIVIQLEYDGRSVLKHRCKCSTENRLPDDVHRLSVEGPR